jgi:hypothetical protein
MTEQHQTINLDMPEIFLERDRDRTCITGDI